jgi:Na+-driven multidrug efflux pump
MELAKKHTTFCVYGSILSAGLYSVALLFLIRPFLRIYGASEATLPYAARYTFWVLTVGAIPTVLNVVLAHLLRADGKPRISSIGMSAGGILNTILDPVFVFGLKLEVAGVAVATLISNTLVCLFFLAYWAKHRSELVTVLSPSYLSLKKEVYSPVMASGVPAAVQTFVVGLFFMFINRQARNYSDIHVAAIGIVQKLDMIAQNVTLGLAQGIIPCLGYSYAAGDYGRMDRVARFSLLCGVSFACLYVIVCELFAPSLVTWFIPDSPETIALGTYFNRVMCVCTPFMAVCKYTQPHVPGDGAGQRGAFRLPVPQGIRRPAGIVSAGLFFSRARAAAGADGGGFLRLGVSILPVPQIPRADRPRGARGELNRALESPVDDGVLPALFA